MKEMIRKYVCGFITKASDEDSYWMRFVLIGLAIVYIIALVISSIVASALALAIAISVMYKITEFAFDISYHAIMWTDVIGFKAAEMISFFAVMMVSFWIVIFVFVRVMAWWDKK